MFFDPSTGFQASMVDKSPEASVGLNLERGAQMLWHSEQQVNSHLFALILY
jgi:hypothetical protein